MDALNRTHEQVAQECRRPTVVPVEGEEIEIQPARVLHVARAEGDERETATLQMGQPFLEVIRKPKIVIRHVSNVGCRRLPEKIVAQTVSEPWRLRKPIETDPRIMKAAHDRFCFIAGAVADDVKLEIAVRLCKYRRNRGRERVGASVRWQDNVNGWHDR
jgi:hypothetical protein